MQSDAAALVELMDKLAKHEAWLPLGYASFEMLSQIEVNLNAKDIERLRQAKSGETIGAVLAPHPGPVPGTMTKAARESAPNITNSENKCISGNARYGGESKYLSVLLARDYPAIKARLDAGEFPSVRAAALAAGIVQPSFQCPADPVKAAARLRKRFTGEALVILVRELTKKDQ